MRCLVTTAPSGSFDEAGELAQRFGLEAQPRADRAISELVEAAAGAPVLILSKAQADLVHRGRVFRASFGMGFLRLVRARRGEVPESAEALRERCLGGNSSEFGMVAHVGYRLDVDEYRRLCPYVDEIEA